MVGSWYKRCMPSIADAKVILEATAEQVKKISGVKKLYVFGSYATHVAEPEFRIKDIDLLAATTYHSEDLQSVNKSVFGMKHEKLEDEGFDPDTVAFSNDFIKFDDTGLIDHWVISSDKKLLHWGPTATSRKESDEIKIEAEVYASDQTGFNLHKIQKISGKKRDVWYQTFSKYLHAQIGDMPPGWYCSEETDIKEILEHAIQA
jgi:predicted nucleotidyltransferase